MTPGESTDSAVTATESGEKASPRRRKIVVTLELREGGDPRGVFAQIVEAVKASLAVRTVSAVEVLDEQLGATFVIDEQSEKRAWGHIPETLDARAEGISGPSRGSTRIDVTPDDPELRAELEFLLKRERETLERLA